jgi:hypothetical protein
MTGSIAKPFSNFNLLKARKGRTKSLRKKEAKSDKIQPDPDCVSLSTLIFKTVYA